MRMLAATALLLATASAARPAPTCAPPPELAAWTAQRPLAAGKGAGDAAPLAVGAAAQVRLLPAARVVFPVAPAKPGVSGRAGVLVFEVVRPGRYRIALGSAAWIEVVRNGRAVASAAHAHGAACAGIRKLVDFDLRPGRHFLEIAGAPDASAGVLVARIG